MARKLGDLAIGSVLLVFVISAISILFFGFDSTTGYYNQYTNDTLTELSSVGSTDLETNFIGSTDSISEVDVSSSQLEIRGSGAPSLLSGDSSNLFINFIGKLFVSFPFVHSLIYGVLISLLGITVTILFLRFFWGEGKI